MKRFLVIVALILSSGLPATAQPPAGIPTDPTIMAWFQSLKMPGTDISCCGIGDCRFIDDWRTAGQGYQVLIDSKWVDIPTEAVLHRTDNPNGRAVLCLSPDLARIYCFTPGMES